MLASLPMYDLPEVRAATDAWWRAIARALRQAGFDDVPDALTRSAVREEAWRSPDLLLTQTCGYPLRFALAGSLSACAAPVYAAPGCEGHLYSSALVTREGDPARSLEGFRDRVVAVNGPDSQSGCNCLRAMVAPLAARGRFFSRVLWTRTHRGSIAALREGQADLAAIDAVTHALLSHHAPDELEGLEIIDWSPMVPALPYAVSARLPAEDAERICDALREAANDPGVTAARAALLIDDIVPIDDGAYEPVVEMRASARAFDYRELDGELSED